MPFLSPGLAYASVSNRLIRDAPTYIIVLTLTLTLTTPAPSVTMRLIIRDDASKASAYVASYIVDRIRAFNPTPENPFVLGLPTGSSPQGVYKILVQKYKAGEVSAAS